MSTWSLSTLLAGLHLDIERRLATARQTLAHPGAKGDASEHVWLELLQTYLPRRYHAETAHVVDSKGVFTFDGNKPLLQGVYFLVLAKNRIFDFVVGNDQYFSLETAADDYLKNMKVKGDEDNELFVENMNFNMERHKEAEPFIKIIQDSTLKEEQKKEAREAFGKVNVTVIAFQRKLIADHPTTLTARILKATQTIVVPDPPRKPNGSIDSSFQFHYYRDHFFDNFDLADDALIRLPKPFYQEKVKEWCAQS